MTDIPEQPSRFDQIEVIVARVAEQQGVNTEAITNLTSKIDVLSESVTELTYNVNNLTNDVTRILGRSAILDDVLLELRDSHETLQQSFLEHQRTTNAALNQLGAILIQLTRIEPQN